MDLRPLFNVKLSRLSLVPVDGLGRGPGSLRWQQGPCFPVQAVHSPALFFQTETHRLHFVPSSWSATEKCNCRCGRRAQRWTLQKGRAERHLSWRQVPSRSRHAPVRVYEAVERKKAARGTPDKCSFESRSSGLDRPDHLPQIKNTVSDTQPPESHCALPEFSTWVNSHIKISSHMKLSFGLLPHPETRSPAPEATQSLSSSSAEKPQFSSESRISKKAASRASHT